MIEDILIGTGFVLALILIVTSLVYRKKSASSLYAASGAAIFFLVDIALEKPLAAGIWILICIFNLCMFGAAKYFELLIEIAKK